MSLVTCPLFDVSKMDHRGAVLPGTIFFISGEEAEFQINILGLKTSNSEPEDCGDEAASWFSSFVGKECRLGRPLYPLRPILNDI